MRAPCGKQHCLHRHLRHHCHLLHDGNVVQNVEGVLALQGRGSARGSQGEKSVGRNNKPGLSIFLGLVLLLQFPTIIMAAKLTPRLDVLELELKEAQLGIVELKANHLQLEVIVQNVREEMDKEKEQLGQQTGSQLSDAGHQPAVLSADYDSYDVTELPAGVHNTSRATDGNNWEQLQSRIFHLFAMAGILLLFLTVALCVTISTLILAKKKMDLVATKAEKRLQLLLRYESVNHQEDPPASPPPPSPPLPPPPPALELSSPFPNFPVSQSNAAAVNILVAAVASVLGGARGERE